RRVDPACGWRPRPPQVAPPPPPEAGPRPCHRERTLVAGRAGTAASPHLSFQALNPKNRAYLPPLSDQDLASSPRQRGLARSLLQSPGSRGRSSDKGGKDMRTRVRAVLYLLLLVGVSCAKDGDNPMGPEASSVPASPPRIRSVVVVPSAIARG